MRVKLLQTAVYWGNPLPDGYGGFTFDSPEEISVRWEDRQELFAKTADQQMLSTAVVYTAQDVDVNGYLFLGTLNDLDSSGLPQEQDGAYMVQAFAKIPNLNNTFYLRKVWL